MAQALSIGIAGLGTVGGGTLKLLSDNAALIAARAGRPIAVTAVSARDRARDRGLSVAGLRWFDDPVALAADPGIDVLVEAIGGSEGPARAAVEAALALGKPVVTANKAMLAVHGAAIAALAEAKGAPLLFEAAVAGGIPAIKALREGLAANRISRVAGILNGTCNYILSTMRAEGREFAEVLAEAQKLGYAEADPSFDIDGIDAAHKLAILAALAFGRPVDFAAVHVEGIREVSALDIVDGVFNAVAFEGDFVGRVMLEGRGAGAGPTASAIVADIIDIARGRLTPTFGVTAGLLSAEPAVPITARQGAYYLRLMVVDRPGVIADVSAILRDHAVSLESMLQRGRSPGEAVPVVLTTHVCQEAAMAAALKRIAELEAIIAPPAMLRIEAL